MERKKKYIEIRKEARDAAKGTSGRTLSEWFVMFLVVDTCLLK